MSTEPAVAATSSTEPSRAGTMSHCPVASVSHMIQVAAPAAEVYEIVADVSTWPLYFPPTVRAMRIGGDDRDEQIRLWAMANGELRTWTSRRSLDRAALTVDFMQTEPRDPVAMMTGRWTVTALTDATSHVRLDHTYRAVDDDPTRLAFIERAVDTNSQSELEHLRRAAERATAEPELFLDFADSLEVSGTPDEAYAFINEADQWATRLPHVAEVILVENTPGLQHLTMDTRSPDGSVHRTVSGRVCESANRIVYKQTVLPGVLAAHIGEWSFTSSGEGRTTVTSRHQVILAPEGIAELPAPPASLDEARTAVRHALGSNSRATMSTLGTHLEDR